MTNERLLATSLLLSQAKEECLLSNLLDTYVVTPRMQHLGWPCDTAI